MTIGLATRAPLPGIIAWQTASGTLFSAYTAAKTVINAAAVVSLPPNFLYVGKMLRISTLLGISNIITAQPTFTFQIMVGAVIAWTSGAILTTTTAHTLLPVELVVTLRVDSVGAGTAAKVLGHGVLTGQMWILSGATADSVVTHPTLMVPVTAPAVGTGYDSTAANNLDFFVGISASDALNGVQVYNYVVEDLN